MDLLSNRLHPDILNPSDLARILTSTAFAQQARDMTVNLSPTIDDALATALVAVESCCAILREELDKCGADDTLDTELPFDKRLRGDERVDGQVTTYEFTGNVDPYVPIVVRCVDQHRNGSTTTDPSSSLVEAVIEKDLLEEMLVPFLESSDLVALRTASMVVHEVMMCTVLDFWNENLVLSLDQFQALARLTEIRKFKVVSYRCECPAARALAQLDLGATISGAGNGSEELPGLGFGRQWHITGLKLDRAGILPDEFKSMLRDNISPDIITKLDCQLRACIRADQEDQEDNDDAVWGDDVEVGFDLSFISHLARLTHLQLAGKDMPWIGIFSPCLVTGSLFHLLTLTRLQHLDLVHSRVGGGLYHLRNLTVLQSVSLNNTLVSGNLSFCQNLTQLQKLDLDNTHVDGSLAVLQHLTQLQQLSLTNTQVKGCLSSLQNLTQLQSLSLNHTQVSGSVTSLPQLSDLLCLFVHGTRVNFSTQDQLVTFGQQHPNCRISHNGRLS